jgi:hypothetical protein
MFCYFFAVNYLRVDVEEFGGAWNIVSEGMMNGFAAFIVC